MNVSTNDAGRVCIELTTQKEIDALWLLTSHIGGGPDTLRTVFSNNYRSTPGLYEQLMPYVSPAYVQTQDGKRRGAPRRVTELARQHQQTIEGVITFTRHTEPPMAVTHHTPLPSASYQDTQDA